MRNEITAREKVTNYAIFIRTPWNWKMVQADLGLKRDRIFAIIKELREKGEIRLVSAPKHGMYLHVRWAGKNTDKTEGQRDREKGRKRMTFGQQRVLEILTDGAWHWSYDLKDYEAIRQIAQKGWCELVKEGRYNKVRINEAGSAALRSAAGGKDV